MLNNLEIWKEKQSELKSYLNMKNSRKWQIELDHQMESLVIPDDLKLIGGIDISFDKDDNNLANVCLAVLDIETKKLLKKHQKIVRITEPYVPNFLAFRECEHMVTVITEYIDLYPNFQPQVILVDGNGVYHAFGFGSACHLGVRLEQEGIAIPTIGVSKNYLQIDGMMSRVELKQMVMNQVTNKQELLLDLTHPDNLDAMCTVRVQRNHKSNINKPSSDKTVGKMLFISVGHGITLKTAVNTVRLCSKHRIPEPILQADHYSKDTLIKYAKSQL